MTMISIHHLFIFLKHRKWAARLYTQTLSLQLSLGFHSYFRGRLSIISDKLLIIAWHRPGLTLSAPLFCYPSETALAASFQSCPSERHVTGYSFFSTVSFCLCHSLYLICAFIILHLPFHPTPSSSLPTTHCRHAASKGRKVRSSLQPVRCARLWYLSPLHAYLELSVFGHDLVCINKVI